LSKLLERLVAKQLLDYLTTFRLLPDQQSAYRAYHSTETAQITEANEANFAVFCQHFAHAQNFLTNQKLLKFPGIPERELRLPQFPVELATD